MATTAERSAAATGVRRRESVVARLAARQAIRGAAIWGGIFALLFIIVGVGYTSAYPTEADRLAVAGELTDNVAFEALLGPAREIETVGGFVAWRIGALIALIAAVWSFLAATRLLRDQEDEGRWDALLSGPVTRMGGTAATLAGIGVAAAALWGITALGPLVLSALEAEVSVGGALYLALAATVTAAAFAAVGALTSQLVPSRREAAGIAAAIFALAFVARVAADSSEALDWMRWATPFGWAIELRPFADPEPFLLVPLAVWTAAFSGAALLLARGRDVGGAVFELRSDHRPHTQLLGSPAAVAVRAALGSFAGWALGLVFVGIVFGLLAVDVAAAGADMPGWEALREELGVDLATPEGYLGLIFLLVAIAVSIYAATHITAWRDEEAHGRLDVVFAKPHGRREWLGGRIAVAIAATAALAILAGISGWLGAAVRGSGVSLWAMLEAGVNMIPLAALFLGIGVLLFSVLPRQAGALVYGGIAAAYVWELTGTIIDAPAWLLELSPFHHLALVPAASLDPVASGVMLAVGVIAGAVGVELFRRRDLIGA